MEIKTKIYLNEEQQTLLIPLFAKAEDNPILQDEKSKDILEHIHYDFLQLDIPEKTANTVRIRAKQFDKYASSFIADHPDAMILHLGCGLDSRCQRVERAGTLWYDLDMPEVIKLRRLFYREDDNYHMISSSVTDLSWIKSVQAGERPVFIMAEGLMMYLQESDVRILLLYLHESFPGSIMVFDVFSNMTVERVHAHPSIKKTGAKVQWGLDDPHAIEEWNKGIRLREEWYFHQSPDIEKLNCFNRFMFSFTSSIPAVRNAQRLLVYNL